ncbi:MAG: phosphonate metabolism protein/1,5-bisphosphokinase (PRPP-forming) PhnN [Pseudomonadota bacterium]
MAGRLIVVVGPSGAGKDTLIEGAMAHLPGLRRIRRVITRPATAGGEDHDGIGFEAFAALSRRGGFAFEWEAHGLRYGLPAEIDAWLAEGQDLLFNGSRATLPALRAAYPQLEIVLLTAPPEVLAARLAARRRESVDEITKRLARRTEPIPKDATVVVNDGTVEDGVARLVAALSVQEESA